MGYLYDTRLPGKGGTGILPVAGYGQDGHATPALLQVPT
jgi:hypothetical protein